MFLESPKRTYIINLDEKLANRVVAECTKMTGADLQKYIDENFKKATSLLSKRKPGAWVEGNMYKDKAKIGVIEMDKRKS